MKNGFRKIITPAAVITLVLVLCVSLSSCIIFPGGSYDLSGEYPEGSIGDWISGLTGDGDTGKSVDKGGSDSIQVIAGDTNTITIEAGDGDGTQYAIAKTLMSTVSVVANFTVRTSGGIWGGSSTSTATSGGAGVIIKLDKERGDAIIVTNYHVVYEVDSTTSNNISSDIGIYLYGSETYLSGSEAMKIPATFVGGSMNYDIAVLYVENSSILRESDAQTVSIADSNDIRVGQTVFTVGNQKGEGISVTRGIISMESQTITMTAVDEVSTVTQRVIRVDAAINAGSSGGGLFNDSGELIGIVNAKNIETNVDNIGYAIPSNIAKAIAESIIDYCTESSNEKPVRALIGITVEATASKATYNMSTGFVDITEDVAVAAINSGSPASGKLKAGDVVKTMTIGDKTIEVTRTYHIVDFMLTARVGDTVTLKVLRNGSEMTFSFTITESNLSTVQ